MKKVFCIFVLQLFAVQFLTCTSPHAMAEKKPLVALDKIAIESVTMNDITLHADLLITNPYPLSIEITKSVAETLVEDKKLAYTVSDKSFYVNADKTEKAGFDVTIKFDDMEKAIVNYTSKEELTVTINTLFEVVLPDIPLLPKKTLITYSIVKVVPALKPEFTIKNFLISIPPKEDIAKALVKAKKSPVMMVRLLGLFAGRSDDGAEQELSTLDLVFAITFDAVLTNKTKSKVEFQKFFYNVKMNNVDIMDGISTDIKNEGPTSVMKVANVMNAKEMHHAMILGLFSGMKNIKIRGKVDAKFPDSISEEAVTFYFGDM
jgi:LEA14-like dessication related protein